MPRKERSEGSHKKKEPAPATEETTEGTISYLYNFLQSASSTIFFFHFTAFPAAADFFFPFLSPLTHSVCAPLLLLLQP